MSINQMISYRQFESAIVWKLFLCLVVAIVAVTAFGKIHNKIIEGVPFQHKL